MLLVLLGAESRNLVRRSDESVAPATGYLPAAEEDYDEDLAGYSADTFSLPGYSDGEELTRDTEGLTTTTAGSTWFSFPSSNSTGSSSGFINSFTRNNNNQGSIRDCNVWMPQSM